MRCEKIHLKEKYAFLGEAGRDPLLECYLPLDIGDAYRQSGKRPCMLICPGGGYTCVSPREGEPVALHLLPEGYNVFVLTYSVHPHRFPAQLQEVAAAMELIYENGENWNCDINRIAIMGFSAGGHLAAHYSNAYDIPEVRAVFPDSKPVNASVLCYPVISAQPGTAHMGSFQHLTGCTPPLSREITEKFSCDKLVTEQTPPAFLWHTAADQGVPVNNSLLYAQALARCGVPFALHVYPEGAHGLATVDAQTNGELSPEVQVAADWLPQMKQWLKHTL